MIAALLLGAGRSRDRRILPGAENPFELLSSSTFAGELFTVDLEARGEPDFLCNLDRHPWVAMSTNTRAAEILERGLELQSGRTKGLLPSGFFAEVHAYEVLEHLGRVGEVETFFDTFNEVYRVLKMGGYLCATVPDYRSVWAWGDPGHRRIITAGALDFLSDRHDDRPPSSDYSRLRGCNFRLDAWTVMDGSLKFVLRKEPRLR